MTEIIGRVKSSNSAGGTAEFTPGVSLGDLVYFKDSTGEPVTCRISNLSSGAFKGLTGDFKILDQTRSVPPPYTNLYPYRPESVKGSFLSLGVSRTTMKPVMLRVNDLFKNILIAGKTQSGKTHLNIALSEELIQKKVPHLILDTQGEFIGLQDFDSSVVVTTETEPIIPQLKARNTVVLNLLGLTTAEKGDIIASILEEIKLEKEMDYKRSGKHSSKITFPPLLVTVDEAETYIPNRANSINSHAAKMVVEYAKRMIKFGVGVICVCQQIIKMNTEVRSQCNSTIAFKMSDSGSLNELYNIGYVTKFDVQAVKALRPLECVMTGAIVDQPVIVNLRDIKTPRTKPLDFEAMLGLQKTEVEKLPISETIPDYAGFRTRSRSKREYNSEKMSRDMNILCGGCGKRTHKEMRKQEPGYELPHFHHVCENCNQEYCTLQEKWLISAR